MFGYKYHGNLILISYIVIWVQINLHACGDQSIIKNSTLSLRPPVRSSMTIITTTFSRVINRQVRLGSSVRNYFSVRTIWIRLAAVVSYRGKKVRTVASPAVRAVNKSRDTWNYVQNEPEYAICVIFTTRLYYKALWLIWWGLIWQIRHNHLDDDHCDVTGYRNMSALGTASAMVTSHEDFVMMWSFKGPKLFCVL